MTKSELRQIYLVRQKALSSEQRKKLSERIARHFFESIDLSAIRLLHSFIPIEKFNEVDTTTIMQALWETLPDVRIVAPRINFETGEMESLFYNAESELVQNIWTISEPKNAGGVDPKTIDIVLVPGLAFDRVGHRVGYGKGFYDRFLKTCREDCVKIGLSYFDPVEVIADVHEGDTALNACITPDGIFTAQTWRRKEDLATDKRR